jgi:hypothetical protein
MPPRCIWMAVAWQMVSARLERQRAVSCRIGAQAAECRKPWQAMSVYVDTAENQFGRMKMSHMLADTLKELMEMADLIGVERKWYQGFEKASCPHFDIAQTKRALAIRHGAIEVDRYRLVAVMKTIKANAIDRVRAGQPHGWEARNAENV